MAGVDPVRAGPPAPAPATTGLPPSRSLAARLLRVIFGCYFVVALLVTAGQMIAEYQNAHRRLDADIVAMQRTFGPGLADALWSYDSAVLAGILRGISEMPVVTGVEVRDEHGHVVDSAADRSRASAAPFFDHPFDRSFDLVHHDETGRAHAVGRWVVRSNDAIAFDAVQATLTVIMVNSLVKSVTLWAIFFVVIRRMVGRPLAEIGALLADLDAGNLGRRTLPLRAGARDEIHVLSSAFNAMVGKLRRAFDDNAALMRDLEEANASLVRRVAERTRDLETLARTDQLTGLDNRRALDAALCEQVTLAQGGRRLSVILGDIDDFKAVNDRLGHRTGDEVLVAVARMLRDEVGTSGTVGRWGGEEFMVLCPDHDLGAARDVAERLRRRCEETNHPAAGVRTCSFGVAERLPGEDEGGLLVRVDAALYAAKRQGRNRVETGAPARDEGRRSAA